MKTIKGTNGPDRLYGNAQSDLILGLGESDTIRAGSAPFSILDGGAGDDVIFSSKANDDLLIGGVGSDEFHLRSGRVSVYAGRGNDDVLVGSGEEFLLGGRGNDTLRESGPQSAYTIVHDDDGYTHITRNDGTRGEVIEKGFENLVFDPEPISPSVPTNNSVNPPTNTGATPTPAPVSGGGGSTNGGATGGGGGGDSPPPPVAEPTSTANQGAVGDRNENGGVRIGDGTTPGDKNFTRVESDQDFRPAVDFAVIPRQELDSDAYAPTTSSFDGNVVNQSFDLPAGSQSTANDSQSDRADREATNFIFGFEANTLHDALDAGDNFQLSITTNTGAKYTGHVVSDPSNADHFLIMGDGDSTGGDIPDNQGNATGTFNSEQGIFFGGNIPQAGDVAQVDLDITNSRGQELAGVHNTLRYGAADAVAR